VTAEPPLLVGGVHEKDTDVKVLLATISVKAVGGPGTVAAVVVIKISELNVLGPTLLIAATLNL